MSVITLPQKAQNSLRDIGRLQDIPAVRQVGLFVLVAAVIALGLWLFFWTQKPDYVSLQSGLDAKASGEAADLLRTSQIPFKIDPTSGSLSVPADQAGPARMALAQAGLPASTNAGFESLQGDQGFGTSQFVENARYQHAMEIELGRTIANLRPVREARVHLALPKASAFTRQAEPASASVVLELKSGTALEQGQVNAIIHLVASSIPELPPERVTVVDQFGRLLSNADPDSDDAIGAKQFDQQRKQESMYVQRIQELLEPMTGPGRVSAKVSVDMDFNQTEEARERFGPDPAVVRSEQLSETTSGSSGGAPTGVPGSASNTPTAANTVAPPAAPGTAPAAAAPAAAAAQATGPGTKSSVRNYEIDRTLTHTRQAPGRIKRVTAAVLVDNMQGAAAAAGKKPVERALNAAEIQRIETLVQQAIGFDQTRGDVVSVVNAPFARAAADAADPGLPIWQNPYLRDIARMVLGGLAVLLLIFFVLRPAFRAMLSPSSITNTEVNITQQTATAIVLDSDEPTPAVLASPPKPRMPPPAKTTFDEKLDVARNAVNSDPKRVAQVVREWVDADG